MNINEPRVRERLVNKARYIFALVSHRTKSKFLFTKLHGPNHGNFIYQWLRLVTYKSSNNVITKVMKTNSSNHLQTCSQLLKHMQHWLNGYFDIIKVNNKVFNIAFESYASNKKIPLLGPCNFVQRNFGTKYLSRL